MKQKGTRVGFFKAMIAWAAAFFVFAAPTWAQETPEWDLDIADSEVAQIEGEELHAKDYGWLLTFRMRVANQSSVPPVSKVELVGYDSNEVEVWSDTKTIRRRDFEGAFGGGSSLFVRVLLKDMPDDVALVELSYLKPEEEAAES